VRLASGLGLASIGGFGPFEVPWLEAKLAGRALYIVAGTIARQRGQAGRLRAVAIAMALLAFACIVSVALTKHTQGWLAGEMP